MSDYRKYNSTPLEDKIMEEITGGDSKENNKNENNIPLLSIDEILALPEIETVWLVESIVQSQGITIISGLPNHFKSLFVQMLVKAVATGNSLFNQFQTSKGNVLIVDRELPNMRLKRRWSSVGDLHGLPLYFYPYTESFKLDNKQDVEKLQKIVKEYTIKLVVIDTFNRSHFGKELNSPSDVAQVFEPLKVLQEYTSIILIHHSNKSGYKNDVPTPEELLGSVDFIAEADLLFTLRKKDKSSVVVHNLKSRDSEPISPFELSFASYPDGKVEMLYEGEITPEDTPLQLREKAIIDFLKNGKQSKVSLIRHMAGLGHNEKTVNNNITVLRKKKIIDSEQIGREAYYFLLEDNYTATNNDSQLNNTKKEGNKETYKDSPKNQSKLFPDNIQETTIQKPCYSCKSTKFWRTKYNNIVCAACHPPTSEEEVKEWVS